MIKELMIRTTKIDSEKTIENEVRTMRSVTQWKSNMDRGQISRVNTKLKT